ncbi:MAG: DNA recombination protein RmuC [Tenericutes bacterium]|nr:DNA recombination protein RmuC [Mycoplasmatota bacterium]
MLFLLIDLQDVLGVLGIILSIIIIVLLTLFLQKKNSNPNEGLSEVEDSIIDRVGDVEKSLTKSIYESMIKFNSEVNEQLRKQTDLSNDNITEFRLNVNKELVNFQSKINKDLSQDFRSLNENIEKRMSSINEKVEERLTKGFIDTKETFVEIEKRFAVIVHAQEKIQNLSKDILGLQNILSNNQARGAFGEYQLNQLLFSVFGENNKLYQTQYTFKKGAKETVRADAVVFMPQPHGMIAIDSKFPYSAYAELFDNKDLTKERELELIRNFKAEVKKHITDVSKKYIVAGETTDYALMFVPSDGILALLHSKASTVVEYARDKNITIVSPTTIVPLLTSFQTIVIDYERSKHMKEIIDQLKKLKSNFRIFGEDWNKLNRTIDTLRKDRDKVNTRVEKLTDKFNDIDNVSFIENQSKKVISPNENDKENIE